MKKIIMLNDDCSSANENVSKPYNKKDYNNSYAFFCEQASSKDFEIIIAYYKDYKDKSISNGWTFKDNGWQKTGIEPVKFVYDKFPGDNEYSRNIKQELYKAKIPILNNFELENIIKDKYLNYKYFNDIIPYTVPINGSKKDIVEAIKDIRQRFLHPDLDSNTLFFKPRYGAAGKKIIIVKGDDFEELADIEYKDYIMQPFLDTSQGLPKLNIDGKYDLRIISFNDKQKITYARLPKENKLISNLVHGGKIIYFDISKVPLEFKETVKNIDLKLKHYNPRFYSCDMAKGKSGKVWLFEMNGKPGLVWNRKDVEGIKISKQTVFDLIEILSECV